MHNFLLNNQHPLEVDHIHHVNYDNRKSQLRVVTSSQNNMNKRPTNKFGIKGVILTKYNSWEAELRIDKKRYLLKRFKNVTDAINARIEAEKIHFGEYRHEWEHDIKWDLLLDYEKTLKGD
jgi:hypothetical protein